MLRKNAETEEIKKVQNPSSKAVIAKGD